MNHVNQKGNPALAIIIIKALSQLCYSRLQKFYFSIPNYFGQNPQINCTSSYLFLLPPSASSLAYPSLWWAINLHSQTFLYRHRCPPMLDVPKSSQTSFSNPVLAISLKTHLSPWSIIFQSPSVIAELLALNPTSRTPYPHPTPAEPLFLTTPWPNLTNSTSHWPSQTPIEVV